MNNERFTIDLFGVSDYSVEEVERAEAMATVPQVCQVVSEETSVSRAAVDHVARRIGEAGLLPRGPRGRHAPQFDERHIARVLVGVMAIANGIDHTSVSVAQAVKRIEELSQGGEARVDVYADGDLDDPQSEIVLTPAGSFVDHVALLIRMTRGPISRNDFSATAIGLTFGSGKVYGWIECRTKVLGASRRFNLGLMNAVLKSGMKIEVRVEADVLFRLGELLGDIQLGPQGELPLQEQAAPQISSKTTTPATGGTGPASIDQASQPGANPVNDAVGSNQQDSDERERGQSPTPSTSGQSGETVRDKGIKF
jgi:hypothetical protein